MSSPFQTERFPKHQKKSSINLVPKLYDKKNYVVDLVFTKIHRVLAFEQKPWLKKYIDFNTNMRKQLSSEFGKDFYKLMNNSALGKIQENLRNRVTLKLSKNVMLH